jgi:HAD superfamily hydrolase (TIGR01509 family)
VTGRPADTPNERSGSGAVEAVLLDIDGTLLDSNDAHAQAWSDAFNEAGLEIGSETVLPLVGMGADKLVPRLTGLEADSEQARQLIERRKEVFLKEYLPSVRPFPRATELLARMREDGLRLVVATSASDDELRGLLRALGAEWLADDATSSSDAKRSKPDPDIVRVAVDKAGVGPDRCVMIGDTPYDVEAALNARVRMIAVRCGGWGDDDLRGAAEIYDDPAAILARYDDSPIGRGVRASSAGGVRDRNRSGSKRTRGHGEEESHADGR